MDIAHRRRERDRDKETQLWKRRTSIVQSRCRQLFRGSGALSADFRSIQRYLARGHPHTYSHFMAEENTQGNKTDTAPLPPGMVLGPDGKPCKICTAFRNWKPQTSGNIESDGNNKSRARFIHGQALATTALAGGTVTAVATNSITSTQAKTPLEPPPGCPPDVEQLGRATWAFLHTTAAYYPDKPTTKQRANMLSLLRALPILYPCTWCAQDFGQDIEKHPPDVSSRTTLSRWLCERHNEVNEKLGKEQFNCSEVDERWKDGPSDGSCD